MASLQTNQIQSCANRRYIYLLLHTTQTCDMITVSSIKKIQLLLVAISVKTLRIPSQNCHIMA